MSEPVFLEYDREALDREYNNRKKVSDFEDYLKRYSERSAETRQRMQCRLDVAYGDSAAETLDIFPAVGAGPVPVQIFIHGGYWKMLHKDDFSFVANAFVPVDVATVVVNYALIPTVTMGELVRQCRASVAWCWRNASSFGGDPSRIYVSGHSAGGHLVAMLMATEWAAFDRELPADLIKGGCAISGLYDLEPIPLCYLNDDLQLSPSDVEQYSPTRLTRHSAAPLLVPVGALEGPEFLRQSRDLAEAWRDQGFAPELMVMPDIHHFSIMSELEDATSTLSRAMHRQMQIAS